jgi:hypothetical protein
MDMNYHQDDKFDQLLSKALEKESEFELPQGFADRVAAMAEAHSLQKETQRDRWWWAIGIMSMIGAVVFVLTKVQISQISIVKPSVGVFTFFQGYSGLVIFAISFVISLHLFDKLVLRKQESG